MALDEDIQAHELSLVIDLIEGVKFLIVGLPFGVDVRPTPRTQLSLQRPLAIHEAHIAQVEIFFIAEEAAKLG